MKPFPHVQLGELIVPATVQRAGLNKLPILSMTMRQGLVDQAEKFKKRVASKDTSAYKVVSRGDLVVGFPIDEGVLSFQKKYAEAIVSPAYNIWKVLRPDQVHLPYLERFLRSSRAISYYKSRMRGTTARRRNLPTEQFLALKVPLPTIEVQRRIAAILDHADDLHSKRHEALEKLEFLDEAIFVSLPASADGVCSKPLGDIIRVRSGEFLPQQNQVSKGQYPVFGGNGITGFHDQYIVEPCTIIVGRVGVYCGAIHMAEQKAWVTDNALIVDIKHPNVLPVYLAAAMKHANLNQSPVKNIQLI